MKLKVPVNNWYNYFFYLQSGKIKEEEGSVPCAVYHILFAPTGGLVTLAVLILFLEVVYAHRGIIIVFHYEPVFSASQSK